MATDKPAPKHSSAATIPYIEVFGAREHNLKDLTLQIPREQLVVVTGISGSGKSSLTFDTIYAEGQRRYMESFAAYARAFIGEMKRPDVDKINGLSPVISIDQKTTSRNPRSTVGTTTELYDFFRLLFARAGHAYSYLTGNAMVKQSEEQIINTLMAKYDSKGITLLAPVVKGRKGHYRELFAEIQKQGYTKVRVDGELVNLSPKYQVDRYKAHDIEMVIDRLVPTEKDRQRLIDGVRLSLKQGKGQLQILNEQGKTESFSQFLMDVDTGLSYEEPSPNSFSFNSPYGQCPTCKGLGVIETLSEELVIPDHSLSIMGGAIAPLGEYRDIWIFHKLEAVLKHHKASLSTPWQKLPETVQKEVMHGSNLKLKVNSAKYQREYDTQYEGVINYLQRLYEESSESVKDWVQDFMHSETCPDCKGARLKKESLWFKIDERNISELATMDLNTLQQWLQGLEKRLGTKQALIASEILKEIRKRLSFLLEVGLGYLEMNRPMGTLSGGEAQRIRLATQIGSQLVGVLYILDEPSIGLHQRDNEKLINSLKRLRDIGNSVLVVEHDRDMMLAADYVVDIGPGAGRHGGQIVAQGTPAELLKLPTETAAYLRREKDLFLPAERRQGSGLAISLLGAKGHNLRGVDLHLPLGKLICVTGVSGSGKSSLIHDTLFPILNKHFFNARREPLAYKKISGLEHIDKVIEVDQGAIGRTPRSNPATYVGFFSDIRALFTQLPEAKIRGYKPGRFSFNVKGGRCETCEGGGIRIIEMQFMADVQVVCETCKGKRYNRETLEVRYRGKNIADVLDMTVEQAMGFFEAQPSIHRKIKALNDVGLSYISLGQHATTLSGGEAQRVKLATELSKRDTGKTLYILDEPTTGLHFSDINQLMSVLNLLVNKGNTVLIIEHNLDVIKVADWIIDMGPEGGSGGGTIVAQGTPEQLAKVKGSYTGLFLKEELRLTPKAVK